MKRKEALIRSQKRKIGKGQARPSPTATAAFIKAGIRAHEQPPDGFKVPPSHALEHSGLSIPVDSPTVAGAALA